MKKDKIIYWLTTSALGLFILPGIFFINSPAALEAVKHLGLPEWFRWEASIASFLGGLALVIPNLNKRIKEFAYFGLGIVYISALIAHLSVDGLIPMSFLPVVTFAFLAISYIYYHKLND
jgi:hypothetical protein